jgi:hypothetical protein
MLVRVTLVFAMFVVAMQASGRADNDQIRGRTLDEWSDVLASSEGAERVAAAWAVSQLASRSDASPGDHVGFAELIKLLSDNEPLVRYWGVQGLTTFAERLDAKDGGRTAAANAIEPLLSDAAAAPRIAAAAALVKLNASSAAMQSLIASAAARDESTQLQVASALAGLGSRANPAQTALQQLAASESPYVRRIASRALENLKSAASPAKAK